MSPWNWKFTLFFLGIVFKGCLDGGYEEKRHNARYSQQLQTGTGRRASFKTVPHPRNITTTTLYQHMYQPGRLPHVKFHPSKRSQ